MSDVWVPSSIDKPTSKPMMGARTRAYYWRRPLSHARIDCTASFAKRVPSPRRGPPCARCCGGEEIRIEIDCSIRIATADV
jgi:hypothetical protein